MKIYEKIKLNNPILLAAWPGMGEVALGAIDYIRKDLNMKLFAEIKMDKIYVPEAVLVEKGIGKLPGVPKSYFYYNENPPVIIFESEKQLSGINGKMMIDKIMEIVEQIGVRMIITCAAFPLPINIESNPEIYGIANKKSLLELLGKYRIKAMDSGHISGLNGLLLGYALKGKIDAICLMATMPIYAINISNPKSSASLIEVLNKMFDLNIDLSDIYNQIKENEIRMKNIEENIKGIFSNVEDIEEIEEQEKEQVPGHVMEKIEKLFREAEIDKSRAYLLKKELDRWNLYKTYEDKFLDLFKENH